MEREYKARVTSKGQVTIPLQVRRSLGFNPGDVMDLLKLNREAWNREVQKRNIWTRPVSPEVIADARMGKWSLLLTPTKPVPAEWYPELRGRKVLCLASGGGQQGPILAAVGADVVVLDNPPAQLEQDRMVAEREGLSIRLEHGDMRDLSRFEDESFDLILHPVSNCFVDSVLSVWKESYRVLRPGGTLLAGFVNPIVYIFDMNEWDRGNLVVRYKIPYSDLHDLPKNDLARRVADHNTIEFGHTLQHQIGGQIAAGFAIAGFYEDVSGGDLLDPYRDSQAKAPGFIPGMKRSSLRPSRRPLADDMTLRSTN